MRTALIIITPLLSIILFLTIVQVSVANSISTTGTELVGIQQEIKKYDKENAILKEKVLASSSLFQIASSAATLGFVESKSQLFISTPVPLAINQ